MTTIATPRTAVFLKDLLLKAPIQSWWLSLRLLDGCSHAASLIVNSDYFVMHDPKMKVSR